MLERKRGKKSPSKLRLFASSLLPLSAINTACAILHASASRTGTHRRILTRSRRALGPWAPLQSGAQASMAIMSFFCPLDDLGEPLRLALPNARLRGRALAGGAALSLSCPLEYQRPTD